MSRSTIVHPYLVLAAVALFWAGNAVAGKLAAGHISPMLLTLLRWSFATLFVAPFALPHLRREWPEIRPRLAYLAILGIVGFASFNAIFYLAVTYTTAINVAIEQSAMPLVVFLANFILFRMRVTRLQIVGFSLTLIGVALTTSHGDLTTLFALDLNRGDALMVIAVLLYGGYTVALRSKPKIHWLSTIFVLSFASFLASIVYAGIEFAMGQTQLPDLQGGVAALYTAIFPSLFAQSLYIRGVEMIGPNRANLFINLVPVFGALLAVAIIGEKLHLYHVAALVCVLGGITLAERSARKRRA
ncbi:DMT family transporter [Jiella sp. MQZ9-1]|uniref:DMT family transporter n=1 Tax=Jiella flava TaxID=2816857 RepID=A0A939FZ95_9HYPH|nr:DMT family transporter [Jiella flava]MBO0662950.1 DMT family transporter [Jiella flava]MCD2471290.1 DMT family transporter [Jiella flava]